MANRHLDAGCHSKATQGWLGLAPTRQRAVAAGIRSRLGQTPGRI